MSWNLFSGSWLDQAGFVDTDVNAGLRVSGSGMELDGIFDMSPSGMVLDGTPTDTIDCGASAAAVPFGCSSSVAASAFPRCSSSKVSSTGLGEVKEAKEVQFFVKYGDGVSSVVRPLGRPPPQSRSSGPPTRSSGPRHVPPRLVEMSLEKRLKQVNCCKP